MKITAIHFYLLPILLLVAACTTKKSIQPIPGDRLAAMKLYMDTTDPQIYITETNAVTLTLMGKHWSSGVFSGPSLQVLLDNKPLGFKEINIDTAGRFQLHLPRFSIISTHILKVIQYGAKDGKKEAAIMFNVLPGDN